MLLPPNPVFRFYKGGDGIDGLRGLAPGTGPGAPEDWVGSTTVSLGNDREGLAALVDGSLLRDAIERDPVGYLGQEHVDRFSANPGLLVKLLDAGSASPCTTTRVAVSRESTWACALARPSPGSSSRPSPART